jgi:hypothetical protein
MVDNKDTKYIPKYRARLGTQERATELNNGGATQIVLNRRRSPTGNTDVSSNTPASNVDKDD